MGNMKMKVLILFMPFMVPSVGHDGRRLLKWTGAATRICEILRRGDSQGIEYVIAFDKQCFYSMVTQYPVVLSTLKNHRIYLVDLYPMSRFISRYVTILKSAFTLSKIAREEKVDLLISPEELDSMSLEAYIAAKISGKPWTVIWQDGADPMQQGALAPLTPVNVFSYLNSKALSPSSFAERFAEAISLLTQLKLAEKTLMLAISQSQVDQITSLAPRANFRTIMPANGVDLEEHPKKSKGTNRYQAIFFGRLDPKKGLHDLPLIWKSVVQSIPKAKLAVAGITTNPTFVDEFHRLVDSNQLSENIVFLGEVSRSELIEALMSSTLTLYPSIDDSFSLVVLESLACGTPVVAYDIPAIQENFEQCSAVLRCPIKNIPSMVAKTKYLLTNKLVRNNFKNVAEEFARQYTWENVVKAEKAAYRQVISKFQS